MKKYSIIIMILIALICYAHARDESYVSDGFIGQSARLINGGIAIITVEVTKWNGLEKPMDVKVLDVLHGTNVLSKMTKIYDDEFDPIFNKQFEVGSQWILRIVPRSVDDKNQWSVSYYETSHLRLIGDHVSGNILNYNEQKKIKYSDFKALLAESIKQKKLPNKELQPTVKTPIESGNAQGTAAEL